MAPDMAPVAAPARPKKLIHQLEIKPLFEKLTDKEKLYSHHLSRAAWLGGRILMRQVSPEGPAIFDFIMALHSTCEGEWSRLAQDTGVVSDELDEFLDYSAQFLCNMGNYYGSGNQKFIPTISKENLTRLASTSEKATELLRECIEPMFKIPPRAIGYPDGNNQSNYYLGDTVTKAEIDEVGKLMEKHSIEPENTRLRKLTESLKVIFEVLQASSETDEVPRQLDTTGPDAEIRVVRGDHSNEMSKICSALGEAAQHASNDQERALISKLLDSFQSGSLDSYREALKIWITDKAPTIELILGFVEPIRDPQGTRAEWEGVVCISDVEESAKLKELGERSTEFVRLLPWAVEGVNDGKGPFEPTRFEAPEFAIVHALAFTSSCIWDAVNLPNYLDIRETCGYKNLMYANRMSTYKNPAYTCPFVDPSDWDGFRKSFHLVRFVLTAIHELLGHGTGKLLSETSPGVFNFDRDHPPKSPLTGQPIDTWYHVGETWPGLGGKLANTIEECRANLVSFFFADNRNLLSLFGYNDCSSPTADDFTYCAYLFLAVEGVLGLPYYDVEEKSWGQPHRRASFAILKHVLLDGGGVISISHKLKEKSLQITVDRDKLLSHGKPSISRMLTKIHIWRCTADIQSCRDLYDPLSTVDGIYEEWRQIVVAHPEPQAMFVQSNTFLTEDGVQIKVYDETNEGIIQSFVERDC